jgi:hypothetical protein
MRKYGKTPGRHDVSMLGTFMGRFSIIGFNKNLMVVFTVSGEKWLCTTSLILQPGPVSLPQKSASAAVFTRPVPRKNGSGLTRKGLCMPGLFPKKFRSVEIRIKNS